MPLLRLATAQPCGPPNAGCAAINDNLRGISAAGRNRRLDDTVRDANGALMRDWPDPQASHSACEWIRSARLRIRPARQVCISRWPTTSEHASVHRKRYKLRSALLLHISGRPSRSRRAAERTGARDAAYQVAEAVGEAMAQPCRPHQTRGNAICATIGSCTVRTKSAARRGSRRGTSSRFWLCASSEFGTTYFVEAAAGTGKTTALVGRIVGKSCFRQQSSLRTERAK